MIRCAGAGGSVLTAGHLGPGGSWRGRLGTHALRDRALAPSIRAIEPNWAIRLGEKVLTREWMVVMRERVRAKAPHWCDPDRRSFRRSNRLELALPPCRFEDQGPASPVPDSSVGSYGIMNTITSIDCRRWAPWFEAMEAFDRVGKTPLRASTPGTASRSPAASPNPAPTSLRSDR